MEKGKQVPSEEVVGVTGIYTKLKTLNEEVRQAAEVCFQCHIPATLIRLALIVRIGKCILMYQLPTMLYMVNTIKG